VSVPPPLTANEDLLDRAILRAVFLERLKASDVRKLMVLLNDQVFPDLLERIRKVLERVASRGPDVGLHSQKQLQDLAASIRDIIQAGTGDAYAALKDSLGDIALSESNWQIAALSQASDAPALGLDFTAPAPSVLRSIVTSRPFQGALLRDWFKGLTRSTQDKVKAAINIGLVEGQSVDEIVARLRGTRAAKFADGVLQGTRRDVESVVRTAINHVSTQARQETLSANADLLRGVQWRSTLDLRTTEICISLDGEEFPIDEGPRPPAHWNCRSKVVPVLKSWQELGIDRQQASASTRASMDGQVPSDLTYGDWLKRQSAARQDQVLGKGKAQLFRDGEISVDQFVDDRGHVLTLQELEALTN